ncbi:uncharacterized protein BKA78DRAFT_116589 [Phyllosticta capitalensis]|uniref:uncharacterized protein n=1 Tax=Phyllosticta capitalensis TaxID=121624 RepID=UPI0031308D63
MTERVGKTKSSRWPSNAPWRFGCDELQIFKTWSKTERLQIRSQLNNVRRYLHGLTQNDIELVTHTLRAYAPSKATKQATRRRHRVALQKPPAHDSPAPLLLVNQSSSQPVAHRQSSIATTATTHAHPDLLCPHADTERNETGPILHQSPAFSSYSHLPPNSQPTTPQTDPTDWQRRHPITCRC